MKCIIFFALLFGILSAGAKELPPLEVKEISPRTRSEVREYLNSLPRKDLRKIHELRKELQKELRREEALGTLSLATLTGLGAGSMPFLSRMNEGKVNMVFRGRLFSLSPNFYRKGFKLLGGASLILGFVAFLEMGSFDDEEGLGLEEDPLDEIHTSVDWYIESLNLEELEKVVKDIKTLREDPSFSH